MRLMAVAGYRLDAALDDQRRRVREGGNSNIRCQAYLDAACSGNGHLNVDQQFVADRHDFHQLAVWCYYYARGLSDHCHDLAGEGCTNRHSIKVSDSLFQPFTQVGNFAAGFGDLGFDVFQILLPPLKLAQSNFRAAASLAGDARFQFAGYAGQFGELPLLFKQAVARRVALLDQRPGAFKFLAQGFHLLAACVKLVARAGGLNARSHQAFLKNRQLALEGALSCVEQLFLGLQQVFAPQLGGVGNDIVREYQSRGGRLLGAQAGLLGHCRDVFMQHGIASRL